MEKERDVARRVARLAHDEWKKEVMAKMLARGGEKFLEKRLMSSEKNNVRMERRKNQSVVWGSHVRHFSRPDIFDLGLTLLQNISFTLGIELANSTSGDIGVGEEAHWREERVHSNGERGDPERQAGAKDCDGDS